VFDELLFDELRPVGCPWCHPFGGDCCRCHGTGRAVFYWVMLTNLWDVRGCDCATCRRLRVRRRAMEKAAQ
jgi:hypothetical protein